MILLLIATLLAVPGQSTAPDCTTGDTCRAQALIAEAAGDFEHFHDLAWRAVQKGKRNDPELMVMLARAMALSGRPGDAIVMLSRLADMGVKVDASGDDFRVVRTLEDWPAVEAKLTALSGPAITDAAPPPATAPATPPSSVPAPDPKPISGTAKAEPSPREPKPSPRAPSPPEPGAVEPMAGSRDPKEPEFSFSAPESATSGLAYDAVSRRFLVSDRSAGRLMVIDQASHHVVPLVSAAGAGFYDRLTAFRIDARRGDLWVTSTRDDGGHSESALHKLQLVSGRPIFEIQATSFGDVRLVDVAVADDGTVYALDGADSRVFRVRPGSRTLELVTRTEVDAPTAFDVVDDRTAFVAGTAGISRVDLSTGHAVVLRSKTPLGTVVALDVRGQALFVLQQSSDGDQLVRCKLDRAGHALSAVSVIDTATAIGRAGDTLYYLAAPGVIKSLRHRP